MPIPSIFRSLFTRSAGSRSSQVWSAPAGDDEHPEQDARSRVGGGGSPGAWENVIARLQQRRNSHVIGLIHRHPRPSEHPYEWYYDAVIGETHAEDFLTALARVPGSARLDVVLHAIGAFPPAFQQIARAIKAHRGETTLFVPYYAHSLSTLITPAAGTLALGPSASLSYIEFPDLPTVLREKGAKRVLDFTVMLSHLQSMFQREIKELVCELAHGGAHGHSCPLGRELIGMTRSSSSPITPIQAQTIGLPVTTQVPDEVFALVRACRAAPMRDHGVKTAERVMAPVHAIAHPATSPFLLPDVARGLSVPASPPVPERTRRLPEPRHDANDDHDDDDESAGGVALENCDITVRPLIARLEANRGSRVICVIHQPDMESDSVDSATAEDILSALQLTPAGRPVDIILHTPGGYSFQSKQIANALKAHKGRKTVFVPYFSMSGGTIIALAADEIVMAQHAVLGPIDTQLFVSSLHWFFPSRAIVKLGETKPRHRIHDELLDLGRRCRRSIDEDHRDALALMQGTYSSTVANRVVHRLNDGELTHAYPVTAAAAAKLGLKIGVNMPAEVVQIVRAFRRNRNGKRSVVYCV